MDEFNAGSRRRNIADDSGGLDLAKSGPDFQLHGVADRQALIGIQERAAEREDANARGPAARSRDDSLHGMLHARAKVPARSRVSLAGFCARAFRYSSARGSGPIFQQAQRFL